MSPLILQFLLSLAILTALDAFWFTVIMNRFFIDHVAHLLTIRSGHITLKWMPALLVYTALGLGIVLFALPAGGLLSAYPVWARGAAFGFVVFSVYEGTNATLLKEWPLSLVVTDVLWGMVACGLTTHAVSLLTH